MNISIIDYGTSNLMSVKNALKKIGHNSEITNSADTINKSDRIILPGVGAFEKGMEGLRKNNLIEPLTKCAFDKKIPILGICLGFQLMAKKSYEFGVHKGLGWIDAEIKKFKKIKFDTTHMGWNEVKIKKNENVFKGLSKKEVFYFANSYFVEIKDKEIETSTCNYGINFTSSIKLKNLIGIQFHPEKSQLPGLLIYKNFIENYVH
jgi:imidazole glycerol-phosphate synthase subunit HisH